MSGEVGLEKSSLRQTDGARCVYSVETVDFVGIISGGRASQRKLQPRVLAGATLFMSPDIPG
jgi:hypothetical protein